jgi:hypothetical protein
MKWENRMHSVQPRISERLISNRFSLSREALQSGENVSWHDVEAVPRLVTKALQVRIGTGLMAIS